MEEIINQNEENQYAGNQYAEHGVYQAPNFTEAVKTCFKKYADFTGRARRSEFWYYTLFQTIVGIIAVVVIFLLAAVSRMMGSIWLMGIGGILMLMVMLALALPGWAASFRRLHDSGRSGWWAGASMLLAMFGNVLEQLLKPSLSGAALFDDTAIKAYEQQMQDFAYLSIGIGICQLGYAIWLIVLLCRDSDRGENEYGDSPKYY